MTGAVMVFASMVAAPASAFLCPWQWLYFFALYPASALGGLRFTYFRNLFFIALPPFAAFLWAVATNHPESASRSLRWICAAASGIYFAGALGPSGIASVLSAAGARRLSETMALAGSAASSAGRIWKRNKDLPAAQRLWTTLKESASPAASIGVPFHPPGPFPVILAAVSWVFLLVSVSGRAS